MATTTEDMRLTGEDWLHLIMIFGPILLILFLLVTPKEAIGCGPDRRSLRRQPAAATPRPGSSNWRRIRPATPAPPAGGRRPCWRCSSSSTRNSATGRASCSAALGDAGILISTLYLMFLAVSVIDFCLNFTGLSGFIALDILNLLR